MKRIYRNVKHALLGMLLLQFLFSDSPLSERYHTYAEIDSILQDWNEEFGGFESLNSPYTDSGVIFKLIEIGVSTLDNLPFWAVKLSFNADIDEDEPRVLILGQCHAEEILGVEISMELIYRFLHPDEYPSDYQTLAGILYSSEVWIIPTYNPEGLSVVHGWQEDEEWIQDVSYRKNKMDANHNGVFDFDTNGYGNDIDGVDLNRNYSFNWMFGDDFLETDEGCPSNPSYVSNYDYYRGESPFSESEVIAIRDLVEAYDFLLSIAYHSSRSGCVAERVIYSWLWPGGKVSPDYQVIQPLGQDIAELTLKEIGDGNYHFAPSGSMRGNAHDWFYVNTGCIQYLIEVGTDNMQPNDVDLIENTIERNLPGAFQLMKRAAGINYPTGPDKYQVTGIVQDAISREPIEDVEITIEEMNGGILNPRLTDSFGRFRRLLYLDSFNISFKKYGYFDWDTTFIPSADIVSDINVEMLPSNEYDLLLNIETPITHNDEILLIISNDRYNEEFQVESGENTIPLFQGDYRLTIISDDILTHIEEVTIMSETNLSVILHWYDILFDDDFDNLGSWEVISGDWNIDNGVLLSQHDLTYPDFSPPGPIRINTSDIISSEINGAILTLDMSYELEWDKDTLFVDISNSEDSSRVFSFYDQNWVQDRYIEPLELDINSNNTISIGIVSDITISYRGVSLDSINLLYNPADGCKGGDLDHNGDILVTDIIILLNIILGNQVASGFQQCSGDFNSDITLDILDIISILTLILGD